MNDEIIDELFEEDKVDDKDYGHPAKSLFDVLACILIVSFILLLIFLFYGDPDQWDAIRENLWLI